VRRAASHGALPAPRIAALALTAAAMALGVATAVFHVIAIARGQTALPGDYSLFNAVVALAVSASGVAIAWRRPRNPIGWAFMAAAVGNGLAGVGGQYFLLTADPLGYWLYSWGWVTLLVGIVVTLHTFPTGHPVTPRWRAAVLAAVLFVVAAMLILATSPPVPGDPPSYPGPPLVVTWPEWVAAFWPLLLMAAIVSGFASLIVRFRRSRGEEREQLKWLVVASGPSGIGMAGSLASANVLVTTPAVLLIAIPVALAILRYRLYDIDLLINRTLVYGALSALLAATYFGAAVLLSALLRPFAAESELAVAGSTLAVVILFAPLRSRIQRLVDERFYRAKYDAGRTLDAFSARLRDQVDLDALEREVLGVVGQTVQPTHAALWLREARR
jgi:hypothetical protein